jgi:Domain of unknown function (DUF5914)
VCPWHGLAMSGCSTVFDDGVLVWVRFGDEPSTEAPVLPDRPASCVDAVLRMEARCEPRDVLANRLDPWHGVHLHPYAFSHLTVTSRTEEALDLHVGYRVAPGRTVDVDARFHCPDRRTIVMTIVGGEGTGSVVETHATPLVRSAPGVAPRTAILEATLATSSRPGFAHGLRAAHLLRPVIRLMARRLWTDDVRYAERIYALRSR